MRNYFSNVFFLALLTIAPTFSVYGQEQAQQQKPNQDPQKPEPTIKISSTYVTVPVIVTDRYGRLVTGLDKGDFTVREDGMAQKVDDFSASEAPFSVVLLIDTSRSTVRKLGAIQKAAETFIKQLQPRDRVMVVTFDDKINVISDFTGDVSALKKAIKAAKTGYATRLYDAIHFAVTEKLDKLQGRKAIVVLTDGVDTASKQATFESTLDLIAGSGIISYAIQYETRNEGAPILRPILLPGSSVPNGSAFVTPKFGSEAEPRLEPSPTVRHSGQTWRATSFFSAFSSTQQSNVINRQQQAPKRDPYLVAGEYLRAITTVSGARHLRANSIENTSFAFELIANELRNLYTLGYYTTNELRDGNYRKIAVSLKSTDLTVRTRDGYRAPKAEPEDDEDNQDDKKVTPPTKP